MNALSHRPVGTFFLFGALWIAGGGAALFAGSPALLLVPVALTALYAGWQQPKLVFYSLLFTLPFSIEYAVTAFLSTDLPDEPLMLFTGLLAVAGLFYQRNLFPRSVLAGPVFLLLVLSLGWTLLTALFSTDPLLSFKYLLAKGWYLAAFVLAPLVFLRTRKDMAIAGIVLAVPMALVTLLTLARHSFLGFQFATINEALAPFFRNHVNYSAMLVCMLPVWGVIRSGAVSRSIRRWSGIVLALLLAAVFFSYARGAWLALAAGLFALFLLRRNGLFAGFIACVLLATLSFFWLSKGDRYLRFAHDYRTTIFHENFSEHLVATYRLKDVSTAERFYRWVAGVRMVGDRPLTGYGPNTFYDQYKPYAIPAFRTWVSDNKDRSTVHNYFLLLLIEQGIPGLVLFLCLLGALFYYTQLYYRQTRDPFWKRILAANAMILAMLVVVNFLSDLIETDKVGSLFYLCVAVVLMARPPVPLKGELRQVNHSHRGES